MARIIYEAWFYKNPEAKDDDKEEVHRIMYVGVKKGSPAKIKGNERAQIEMNGEDQTCLRTKNLLTKCIGGLELF